LFINKLKYLQFLKYSNTYRLTFVQGDFSLLFDR